MTSWGSQRRPLPAPLPTAGPRTGPGGGSSLLEDEHGGRQHDLTGSWGSHHRLAVARGPRTLGQCNKKDSGVHRDQGA